MTRAQANEILTLHKNGQLYPDHVINMALYLTGDLSDVLE